MSVIRYVFVKLRPGVSIEAFETFEREVDYVRASGNPTIISYRTHRIEAANPGFAEGDWDFIERIEVTDRADYEAQASTGRKAFLDELYDKWLIRDKTRSFWTTLIEP